MAAQRARTLPIKGRGKSMSNWVSFRAHSGWVQFITKQEKYLSQTHNLHVGGVEE